jgi:hypothetical protein
LERIKMSVPGLPWFRVLTEQEVIRLDALKDSAAEMEASFARVEAGHWSPELVRLKSSVARIVADLTT